MNRGELKKSVCLTQKVPGSEPPRLGSEDGSLLGELLLQEIQVQLSSTSVDVDILGSDVKLPVPFPDLVAEVGGKDNREGQVSLEESLCVWLGSNREQSNPELGNDNQDVQDDTVVRTNDTSLGLEAKLVGVSTLDLQCTSKSNVTETDGTPSEKRRHTRDSQHPGEGSALLSRGGNETDQTKDGLKDNTEQWSTLLVNVVEELRSHAGGSQSGQSSGRTENGGVTDGQDSNHDDNVHDRGQATDTGVLDGNDEWRVTSSTVTHTQLGVVVRNKETNQKQGDKVEQGDSPEDLLDGLWHGLSWVDGLGSGQTDQFSTSESESGGDEDGTKTLEAVVEGTGVVPVLGTNVATLRATTTDQDDTQDDETDNGSDLDDGENELGLTVTLDTEEVDDNDENVEDGTVGSGVCFRVPVLDGDGSSDQLQGQHDQPLHGVVPGHGETPRWVDESNVVSDEGTGNRERDGQLTQGLNGGENHRADQGVGDQDGRGTTQRQHTTRTNEQTGTDGTTDGDHLQVSGLQRSGQRRVGGDDGSLLDVGQVRVDPQVLLVESAETVLEGLPLAHGSLVVLGIESVDVDSTVLLSGGLLTRGDVVQFLLGHSVWLPLRDEYFRAGEGGPSGPFIRSWKTASARYDFDKGDSGTCR